jgi:hypothetical protein
MNQIIKTIIALLLIGAIYYKADILGPCLALGCLLISDSFIALLLILNDKTK